MCENMYISISRGMLRLIAELIVEGCVWDFDKNGGWCARGGRGEASLLLGSFGREVGDDFTY